jgi:hypothetical protein
VASIETEVENDSALDRGPNADTALMAVNGSEPTLDLVDAERSCSATHWCERACKRAGSRIRTDDLLITNQLLYQLSYAGIYEGKLLPFTALSRRIVYAICIRWHKTITKCAISIRVPQGATVRVLLQQAS